jgi:hypothetical protein
MPGLSDLQILKAIDRKLSTIVHLYAYTVAKDKTVAEGAPILRRLGLAPSEVAAVFNTTVNVVNVRTADAKKKAAKSKRA